MFAMTSVFFDKTLLDFALLQFVLQDHTCLLFQVSLDFLLCIPIHFDEKDIVLGGVLILEGLAVLHVHACSVTLVMSDSLGTYGL